MSAVDRFVERCFAVVAKPIQFRTMAQQILRGFQLTSTAGIPKSVGDFSRGRCRVFCEVSPKAIHHPQRRAMPDQSVSASLDKPARGAPLSKGNGVR